MIQEERINRFKTAPWFTTEKLTFYLIGAGGIGR